jgi:hypothetical protein
LRLTLLCSTLALIAAFASAPPASARKPRKHKPAFLKVTKFKPRHGKVLVPLATQIVVKFSRPIDPLSLTTQTASLSTLSGDNVPVTYSSDPVRRTLTLTPNVLLTAGTDYRVAVRPGLLSTDGTTLRAEKHAIFFTDPRVSPLQLIRPDQFAPLATSMIEGRAGHSATLLADGRVLFAGGLVDFTNYAVTGDIFDPPQSRVYPALGQTSAPRAFHPAVRFGSGAILVGGSDANGALDSTDVFFPSTANFHAGPRMQEQRDFVAAVQLKDGRVLVVGGLHYNATGGAIYSDTAEILEGGSFRFTSFPPLKRRAGHTLTLLPDGRVLVVGGQAGGASTPPVAETFDPVTETFTQTIGAPSATRQSHTATLIDDKGTVLLVDGGSGVLEIYDAASDSFFPAGGASSVNRNLATASKLPDGSVLIAGGFELRGSLQIALDGFDLYRRTGGDHGSVSRPLVTFPEPRAGHTATSLDDGRVLFAGGFGPVAPESLASLIVFTPDPLPLK